MQARAEVIESSIQENTTYFIQNAKQLLSLVDSDELQKEQIAPVLSGIDWTTFILTANQLSALLSSSKLTDECRRTILDANASKLRFLIPDEIERNNFVKEYQKFVNPIQRLQAALSAYRLQKYLYGFFERRNLPVNPPGLTAKLKTIATETEKPRNLLLTELAEALHVSLGQNTLLAIALNDYGLIDAPKAAAKALTHHLGRDFSAAELEEALPSPLQQNHRL